MVATFVVAFEDEEAREVCLRAARQFRPCLLKIINENESVSTCAAKTRARATRV